MSRRLAADRRRNGQTLQSSESNAHVRDPKEQEGHNRKSRSSRPFEDAGLRPATSPHRPFSPHAEKIDFKKCLQKNVFIDSYYPKVQGDCSETSRKSQSSYEETCEHCSQTESQNTEDSWESGSRETFKMATSNDDGSAAGNSPPQSRTPNRTKRGSRSTLATSFQTFDSRTYTVPSCSSDLESTFVHAGRPQNDEAEEDRRHAPAVGRFTQLYNRIHNLEGLLHETLAKSVHLKESKCTAAAAAAAAAGDVEKPQKSKNKFSKAKSGAAGVVRTWESTCLSIPEVTDEKGNSDTDSELRNIKKRLRVLERKLRETKQQPLQSFSLHRNPRESLTSSSLVFAGIGGRCCARCRFAKSKDTDSTAPLCSETESFLQNEVLLLNSGGSYERKQGNSCDKKARTKVRKKFISKCRGLRRKCSNLVNSTKKNSCRNSPVKVSAASGWSEVLYKRSILTEESVEATLLSQSFSANTRTDSSTVVYLRCQHEGLLEPPPKPRKKNGKKRKYLCKKNSKVNILSTFNSKAPKGELMLRSTPTTDALLLDLPANTLRICDSDKNVHPSVFDKNVWKNSPWQPIPPGDSVAWNSHPLLIPFQDKCCRPPPDRQCDWQQHHNRHCSLKPDKPAKKPVSFRNPLDLLKRGGKIKIPVLFEEVCKTTKSKTPGHKLSNVSMRIVVVEEDTGHPLTPLRKLINRLSQTKPAQKGDHYVFAVSKCHCDSQVYMGEGAALPSGRRKNSKCGHFQMQELDSMSQRNVMTGFS